MNTKKLTAMALNGLDRVGYELESLGITNRVNRHTLAAFMMAEKNRLEGEMDSLHARTARYRALAENATDLAFRPARLANETIRGLLGGKSA
ncbi:hypothetical protein ACMDCT_09580 [Halomonadaceae bacterium KBTZ08]